MPKKLVAAVLFAAALVAIANDPRQSPSHRVSTCVRLSIGTVHAVLAVYDDRLADGSAPTCEVLDKA